MPFPIYDFFYQIQPQDIDFSHHVNNAVYLTIFEKARWDMIKKNGFDGPALQKETQIAPVLLEVNLRFKKEIRQDQQVQVQTHYTEYQSRIAILSQTIQTPNLIHCVGIFKMGLFDVNSRKLVYPTKIWLKALGLES
jgi:acyl-CoA thioester hydrolase